MRRGGASREPEGLPAGEDPRRAIAAVRRHLLWRLVLAGLVWAGALASLVLLLAWGTVDPAGWPQGTVVPLVLHLALLGGVAGGGVALVRWARRHLSDPALARAAGEAVGLPRGAVQVGLELAGSVPPGTSPELAERGARRMGRRLAGRPPRELAGEPGHVVAGAGRMGGVALVVLAVPLVGVGVLSTERAGSAWAGVLQPYALMAAPAYPALSLSPGDARVERGGDVEVTVTAVGRERVVLRWQERGEAAVADTLPVGEDGTAVTTVEGVEAPTEYSAEDPRGESTGPFRLEPVDPLALSSMTIHLTFPEHTGLPPETHREVPGVLSIPEGTHVTLEGRTNRPLDAVTLRPEEAEGEGAGGGPGPDLRVEGDGFRGGWIPRRSGRWSWSVTPAGGGSGVAGAELPALELEVVPDRAPTVEILHPGRRQELPLSFRQPLEVEAVDDHGLERVELVAWSVDPDGNVGEEQSHAMDAGGTREVRLEPVLDVSGWGLSPGDEVRYRVRAVDNAPDPGVGESEEHVLHLPGRGELRRESRETLDGTAARLEELEGESRRAAARARELERRMSRAMSDPGSRPGNPPSESPGGDYQEEEAALQTLEERQRILEELEELRAELEELMDGLRDAGVMDAELHGDLRELQGVLEDLAPEEASREMEDWLERLDEAGAVERRDVLEELGDSQEALRDRLEASLERFRRAAAEEDFRSLGEEGREVAAEERELAERFAEETDEDALRREADGQEELAERARELEEGARNLEERLEAMAEPEAAQQAREARASFQEAREAMEAAAQEARREDGDGAAQEAEEAAARVEEGLEELDRAHEEMAEDWAEALEETLDEMAGSALALARRQGEVSQALTGPGRTSPHALRREEAALLEGVRSLARTAREVAPMDPELAGRLAGALGEAVEAMEETAGALGGVGLPSTSAMARANSEGAAHALNRVARVALEGGGSGEGGGADAMAEALEQLDQLAEEQESLSRDAGELMEMGPDQDGMEDGAEQLGRRQEEVARGLDELGRRPGFDEGSLGDLEVLEEEAADIARELAEGSLDADLRDRQEDLFRRLLDAGRGIDQRGRGEHREGTPADEDAFERPEVEALDADALAPPRFTAPGRGELEGLPPAQRHLVVEYFERLNRRAPESRPPEGP